MTMISRVGRKSAKVRLLFAFLYLVLGLGGASMIYPFLLMLSGSTKSGVDIKDVAWFPEFLMDDGALYRKHIESLFNEQLEIMRAVYDSEDPSFEKVSPPELIRPAFVDEWREFTTKGIPQLSYTIGYMQASVSRTVPLHLRVFKQQMIDQYGPAIQQANRALETEFVGWNAFFLLPEDAFLRRSGPLNSGLGNAWRKYRTEAPDMYRYYFALEGFYKSLFLKTQYTRSIDEYNRVHGTEYASYDDVHLSSTLPKGTPQEKETWVRFVRNSLNLEWIKLDESTTPLYQDYLKAKYMSLDTLNRLYETSWASWMEIPMVNSVPWTGLVRSDWETFITGWTDPDTGKQFQPSAEQLRIDSMDERFRSHLKLKWGSLEDMNRSIGTAFTSWQEIQPPQKESHYLSFMDHKAVIRWEFVTRNFIAALDHLAFHGRGIRNTIIYCLLAIMSALLVNPLAAYAMSRYKPPSSYKLLLFLLLTMAFPPMVTQIPVFLMMRDLNLLNTFAALLLPGLAHGYSIFLLKGFFDALPRELYETASIDGAGEWTMFWHITMSLSKPILAVVALQAFTTSYSNFMFALLICQDEKMWTMMVWLYQLQMRSGPGIVYASLIIAAIPTLIIFIFCQNIILRGIVVPVEK